MSHELISLVSARTPTVWGRHPDHEDLVISFEFENIGFYNIRITQEQAGGLATAIQQELQDRSQPQEETE